MRPYLNIKSRFCLTFFFSFFLGVVYSQNNIYFDHITTDDGLSQNDINSIYQDNQGFIWFATHEGLNKYDGYNFTIYNLDLNNPNSISSNLIFALTGDKNGNLWIGTTGNGLDYFDKTLEKFTHFAHEEGNDNSLVNNYIRSICIDKKNRLWIGTTNGLDMVDLNEPLDSIKFQHFNLSHDHLISGFGENNVYSIFEDRLGQIWAGGLRGLYKLSRDQNGEKYFRLVNDVINLHTISVRSLNEDHYGRLIIGTNDGIFMLQGHGDSKKVVRVSYGFINDVLVERDYIWAGTNNGLLYFNNSNANMIPNLLDQFAYNPNNPNSLSKNIVESLAKDKTGVVWIGTNGGGANKLDRERKHFRHVKKTLSPNSLSYDKIRSMFEDSNGTLWIGTEGGGLNMLLKEKDDNSYLEFENYRSILKPFVTIEIERNGRKLLLIGAEDSPGLYELDITKPEEIIERGDDIKLFGRITGSVFALLEDSNKNLWIGTYSAGVNRWLYDESTGDYKKDILSNNKSNPFSISNDIIRNIFEDSKGNIWFATGEGVCKLSPNELSKKQPKFEVYKNNPEDKNSVSHDYILELFESSHGDLWIGTLGGGLNKFIPSEDGLSGSFESYKTTDGLPNNVIKGILEDDDGNLWLSTNKGLSKFNPSKLDFKNYDLNDGLQSDEFQELARVKRKNGELLFGGINGFNVFYPKDIKDNTIEAETVITELSISNKPVKIGENLNGRVILNKSIHNTEEISLKYKENSFSFEFAALHFAAPEKNQFAYMLEGFNKDWIYTTSSKRFATYTNLAPNTYTLKVKASNNDGIWDPTPSEIKIKVIPPFWLTNIAYTIYSLIIIGLLLLFRRFTIIRTTEKHQLELEHFEKEKSEELQRIKLEFFTNISHEFKTPLTLIKGPLKYLQQQGNKLDNKVLQEQYGLMQRNSDYLLRLVNQLLDFRKINQGKMRLVMRESDMVDFVKEVSEPFQFLAQKNKVLFNIDSSNEPIMAWFDHDAIEKIINNLLSNAFSFTPAEGSIKVEIELQNKGKTIDEGAKEFNNVLIRVKDSGAGIDSAKIENIFERFYTEKDQGTSDAKGAGIGLSFVKDIVELHQGQIKVESELNKGTTFIISLPINKEAYEGIPEITCKEISDSDFHVRSSESDSLAISLNDDIEDLDFDKTRPDQPVLLVVDDNSDIRSFLKQALHDKYIIYEAENGKIGLEVANKLLPNIILTDVLMPVMDGIEFCEKVKTQKQTSHIPVVMLTAKLSQESEIKGLKTGADDYIRKPFDIELLEVKLENIIKHRDQLRERFNKDITFEPKEVTVTTLDERFLQQAIEIVEKHMMNTDFNVEMLVKEMGLSRSNLYLKFKEITGLSSSEFIRNIRLKRAVQLFQKSDYSVKEIMYMTGFNTASYFAKCFKKQFGVIPSEYVRQNVNNENNNK